jgi:hypothetical protein
MSSLTSLKVPIEIRDRLAAAAKARGLTVRALLDDLSRQAIDDALLDQVSVQMSKLAQSDRAGWEDYLGEGRGWEEGTVEHLDA